MTVKTRIYLIRHGEVMGAGVPRYNGHADVPLTERGLAQYEDIKEKMVGSRIAACYSSDLTRCVMGAEILSRHFKVEPSISDALRELNIGIWEGMTWSEITAAYPEMWQARLDDLVNYRVPQGENLVDVHARVMPVIRGIVDRHQGEEVLVVAHGGVNRIILLDAIGAPLSSLFTIEQKYCAFNIIDYYADGKTVVNLVNG
jgi:alpha-ribazole phosphatase